MPVRSPSDHPFLLITTFRSTVYQRGTLLSSRSQDVGRSSSRGRRVGESYRLVFPACLWLLRHSRPPQARSGVPVSYARRCRKDIDAVATRQVAPYLGGGRFRESVVSSEECRMAETRDLLAATTYHGPRTEVNPIVIKRCSRNRALLLNSRNHDCHARNLLTVKAGKTVTSRTVLRSTASSSRA